MGIRIFFLLFFVSYSTFAQTTFEENIIVDDSYVIRPNDAYFGDIDNDGDQDIMTAGGRNVVWLENLDGMGTYGKRKLIANYPIGDNMTSPFLEDIDGDGDLDALASSSFIDRIIWFENLDGLGNFGPEHLVASFSGSIFVSDIDSDGDMDILTSYSYQQKIVWIKNLNGLGQFGNEQTIDLDVPQVRSLKTADLDGDGDNDVLLTSYYDDKVIWYENLDGNGNFGSQKIISTEQNGPTSVYAADIDNDGDLDIISSAGSEIGLYENSDGMGNFAPLRIIASNVPGATGLNVQDIDNDGDADIFAVAIDDNYIAFYENLDGQGNFSTTQIISDIVNLPVSIKIADVNNDNYLDVMCISLKDAKLTWYKNTDGQGTFGNQNVIYEDIDNVENIYAADMDGDGDLDLLSASNNGSIQSNSIIAWFENIDGHGNFGKQKGIDYPASATFVRAADVDGDGDMDVIGGTSSSSTKKIIWYENMDGLANFGEAHDITNGLYNQLTSLEIADFDGDNDIDILANSTNGFGWIENVDGQGNYVEFHSLPYVTGGFDSVSYPVDLDNDGDIDIISWRFDGTGQLIWFENLDGMGSFSSAEFLYALSSGRGKLLTAADMDLDGDIDIVLTNADSNENYMLWIENMGNANFGNATTITEDEWYYKIVLRDLDNDNDIDIAFTKYYQNSIGWIENIDGQGNFGPEIILSDDSLEANSVIISDLDGDTDKDIIASAHLDNKIAWYKNSLILSLYENNYLKFSLYPNPTNGLITIQSEEKISNIKIYNSLGQLMISNVFKNSIDISNLKPGVYFLNAFGINGTQGIVKIIKN